MQHIAHLVNGETTHWRSEPGHFRSVFAEAEQLMRQHHPNASIRLELV